MIDPKLLRENFSFVQERLSTRAVPDNLSSWPKLDEQRRAVISEVEQIRAEKNRVSPDIARGKKEGKDVSALMNQVKAAGDREKELSQQLERIEQELMNIELLIPNLPHESIPLGKSEAENRVEKTWGKKPEFSFTPKPHWDLAENLGIVDFELAAKLSGSRFALYRGAGARLERALTAFMLDHHTKRGYTEIFPPFLVRREIMVGSGQLPKFEADLFKTGTPEAPWYLIPTSEVVLCNMHIDEILAEDTLPRNYTAYTPCFRGEAGSHGKDVRGLIRLHQFNKVELVKITSAETSFQELEKLTADAESILETLGLPYRRVTLCSGDMGMAATKTYDLEVWLPGLNCYREISSCSNTGDYQARRTKTRYRPKQGDKPVLAHMLNGSGLAVGRTFVAVLENYQQQDGSIMIPQALRPYLNGEEIIKN